jgi:hypothetical protein
MGVEYPNEAAPASNRFKKLLYHIDIALPAFSGLFQLSFYTSPRLEPDRKRAG